MIIYHKINWRERNPIFFNVSWRKPYCSSPNIHTSAYAILMNFSKLPATKKYGDFSDMVRSRTWYVGGRRAACTHFATDWIVQKAKVWPVHVRVALNKVKMKTTMQRRLHIGGKKLLGHSCPPENFYNNWENKSRSSDRIVQ